LNVPIDHNRNVEGCFVHDDETGEVLVCRRLGFTSKPPISHDVALASFSNWLVEVDDNGKSAEIIHIATLGSKNFVEEIGEFARQMVELKNRHSGKGKTKPNGPGNVGTHWFAGDEFEGTFKKASKKRTTNCEYSHGPICNALFRYLKLNSGNCDVLKNRSVDVAVISGKSVKAIFEVKTSSGFSDQLYKGIGQLLCYRQKWGDPATRVFLVIPGAADSKSLRNVLSDLEIELVLYDEEDQVFLDVSGKALAI
jgi:hypothetical protein